MNNKLAQAVSSLTAALVLAACGKQDVATPPAASASPTELTDVLKRCRQDRAAVGEPACRAAQEEYRRRFMQPGNSYDSKAASASLDRSVSAGSSEGR